MAEPHSQGALIKNYFYVGHQMHEMVAKFLLFSSTESVFCIVSCQGVVQLGGPDPWYEGKMDICHPPAISAVFPIHRILYLVSTRSILNILKVRLQPHALYN